MMVGFMPYWWPCVYVRICDVEVLVSVNGCVEILGFSVGVFECVFVCGVRPS